METSPHVPARFSIMGDMYIYVCSKGNWTGSPDASVRLSITQIQCVTLLTFVLLGGQRENLNCCSINEYIHKESIHISHMVYNMQCIEEITHYLLLYPVIIYLFVLFHIMNRSGEISCLSTREKETHEELYTPG